MGAPDFLSIDALGWVSIKCFILLFHFSFMIVVANHDESWIISNLYVAHLLLDNLHWIIVDNKAYECQEQLGGLHVPYYSYSSHVGFPK